jgi:hypothetical protein
MMKAKILFWLNLAVFLTAGVCLARAPHQVGGFVLGEQVSEYKDRVKMETALPIRHQEYIHEVEIEEMEGFKSGLVWMGNCANPGQIVRIKLKYDNSTKKFYNTLLSRFKNQFGEPSEWRGDPFHIVIAWKWSFVDDQKNQISLTLQHNTRDEEEKMGNAVKLTMSNRMEAERSCYEKKSAEAHGKSGRQKQKAKDQGKVDWDLLVPK